MNDEAILRERAEAEARRRAAIVSQLREHRPVVELVLELLDTHGLLLNGRGNALRVLDGATRFPGHAGT